MNIVAVVPFKYESSRLPLKNFMKIATWDHAPNLWQATYLVLKRKFAPKQIYWALDETPMCKSALLSWGIVDNVFQEVHDYPKGNTLGDKLSKFIDMMCKSGRFKGVDYVLVPQVDCWPKDEKHIETMIRFAQRHPHVDYWVCQNSDCTMNGNWRLIKIPLRQEVLGQVIGMVPIEAFEIHYEQDLKKLHELYKDGFEYD